MTTTSRLPSPTRDSSLPPCPPSVAVRLGAELLAGPGGADLRAALVEAATEAEHLAEIRRAATHDPRAADWLRDRGIPLTAAAEPPGDEQ